MVTGILNLILKWLMLQGGESDAVFDHDGVDLKIKTLEVSPFAVYLECVLADGSAKPNDDWDILYET